MTPAHLRATATLVLGLGICLGTLWVPAATGAEEDTTVRDEDLIFTPPQRIEFAAPLRVTFEVETEDGAATTTKEEGQTLTTLAGDVNFEVDSDQLTDRAREILDGLAAEWVKAPPSQVTVTGHTDSVASEEYNLDLSQRRAASVGTYLSGKVPGLTVITDGKGEAEPIDDNGTEEGKAANRRVEIRATN